MTLMAGHAQRSSKRPLHNFTLPSKLKWGHQKHLRCNNPNSTPHTSTTTADKRKSPISGGGDDGIEVIREKLMKDFRLATDRLKLTILDGKPKRHNNNSKSNSDEDDKEKKTSEEDLNSLRPWNLRKRRAACKAPIDAAAGVMGNDKSSPLKRVDGRLRTATVIDDKVESKEGNNGQRAKFSLMLTKEEIKKDFLAMTGTKPPRRPKKRSRIVQKQLDALSPGLWLTEITPEMYKVQENAEHGRGER